MKKRLALGVFAIGMASAIADPSAMRPPGPPPKVLAGPPPEVAADVPNVPAVPQFELPVPIAGTHSVLEMHVAGASLLGTDVSVSGYILWIYDCVSAVQQPGESKAKVQKRVDEDPTLCERKKLYLGDAKDTPLEQGLWVVDVPRPPNKLETERLPKSEIKAWPKVPALKVGQFVTITGGFTTMSPHSERNSDGLLVWASYVPATPQKRVMVPVAPPTTRTPPAPVRPMVKPAKDAAAQAASIKASNDATRLYGLKQLPEATAKYREAVTGWEGNHLAWYGLAGIAIGAGNWTAAEDPARKAYELAPDDAMYAMIYGLVVYSKAIDDAKADQAKREGRAPADVRVDLTKINFEKAEGLFGRAAAINDRVWRAHYYLGRIDRDSGRPRLAAEELTKACTHGASIAGPWVALAEIYRAWNRPELAISLTEVGVKTVTQAESADVWYELGMAHDAKHEDAKAIEAFGKALEVSPNHLKAIYQRGQAYFQSGDFVKAKADLEDYAKRGPDDFARQQATHMLLDIAAKPVKRR